MSMEKLNTYCVSKILSHVKYNTVLHYGTVFSGQFEAVASHEHLLQVLDVDEFLDNEISAIDLSLTRNIRTLKVTKVRNLEDFKTFPKAISTHCQHIEVLNIPAIILLNEDVETLSRLTTLRSLSINCREVVDEVLGRLFQSNPGLKEVTIRDFEKTLTGICFEKLPHSIKSLKVIGSWLINPNILLKCMDNWQLESLYLGTILEPGHVEILSEHTTFKSLQIEYLGDDSMLQLLLQNNPQLVKLHVNLLNAQQCSQFFRYLPLTLKKLKLKGDFVFSDNIFFERLKSLDLESFKIVRHRRQLVPPYYLNLSLPEYNSNFIRKLVELAPNLQKLGLPLTIWKHMPFEPLGQLKKLRFLRLDAVHIEINHVLKVISENCLNLEILDLYQMQYLTKEGVEHIVKLPKLKKFSIYRGGNLFNVDCMLILSECKTLETVIITGWDFIEENFSQLPFLVNDTLRFIEFKYVGYNCSNHEFTKVIQRIVDKVNEQTGRKEVLTLTLPLDIQRRKGVCTNEEDNVSSNFLLQHLRNLIQKIQFI